MEKELRESHSAAYSCVFPVETDAVCVTRFRMQWEITIHAARFDKFAVPFNRTRDDVADRNIESH